MQIPGMVERDDLKFATFVPNVPNVLQKKPRLNSRPQLTMNHITSVKQLLKLAHQPSYLMK